MATIIECPACHKKYSLKEGAKTSICRGCHTRLVLKRNKAVFDYPDIDKKDLNTVVDANLSLYKLKYYKRALNNYKILNQKYSDNKDFLLGLILSLSCEFKKNDYLLNEAMLVIHYWELYEKIASKKEIDNYIEDINEIKGNLDNYHFSHKMIFSFAGTFCVVVIMLYLILTSFIDVTKKDVVVKTSELATISASELVNDFILSCDLKDVNILEENNIQIIFKCGSLLRRNLTSIFTYSYIDDSAPIIESSECDLYEGEEFDSTCIKVVDDIDGEITDFEIDTSEANFKYAGTTYVKVSVSDKAGNTLETEISVKISKTPIEEFNVYASKTTLKVGETLALKYSIKPSTLPDHSVIFNSSDDEIATVTDSGHVSAKSVGDVNICAISNYNDDESACVTLTIVDK